ncbi:hypothetical protein [Endozoicomonas ascidiicola]|uniref:hypothetical protein n=1 Tax=Endozoicomonas ascidiicola TaxID=1698521 RepID=UPI0008311BA1|nr:hypothetical protein [Endozoicomonas ascidiicola]
MNAFERKMVEQLSLISTLAFAINQLSSEFYVEFHYHGQTKRLVVWFNESPRRTYPKIVGKHRVYYAMRLESYLEAQHQEEPFPDCCTNEQIIHVLHQIRQAEIQGRTDENQDAAGNHTATATTTGLDQRSGTDGELPTEGAEVCYGSPIRTGREPEGSVSAMA